MAMVPVVAEAETSVPRALDAQRCLDKSTHSANVKRAKLATDSRSAKVIFPWCILSSFNESVYMM